MNVFSKPFNEVTFADVVAFGEQKHPESTTLDYKRELPETSPNTLRHFQTL